jgi:hypothetical protein
MQHINKYFEGPLKAALVRELRMMELLLDDNGLDELRKQSVSHPAVQRYDTIRAVINNNGAVNYPDETDLVLQAGSTLLDALRPREFTRVRHWAH